MKKLIGALLAFVMMLTLAGCGSSSASESKWARRGQFADENLNYLTITDVTEMDLGIRNQIIRTGYLHDVIPAVIFRIIIPGIRDHLRLRIIHEQTKVIVLYPDHQQA